MAAVEDEAMCTCGHPASEHHRSWFPGGGVWIEECEHYDSNETGGLMYLEELGKWIPHCSVFMSVQA